MKQGYKHFDHKERTLISWWRKEKLSLREIGRRLRRSHPSVSRELRRHRWCGKEYFPRGGADPRGCSASTLSEAGAVKIEVSPGVCA